MFNPFYFDGFSKADRYNKDEIVHHIYFKGSQVVISHAAFHLGLHCFPNYPFKGFQYTKG